MSYLERVGSAELPEFRRTEMAATFIPPAGFVGEEAVTLPEPPKVPVIERVPTRSGVWVMATATLPTVAPKARRTR